MPRLSRSLVLAAVCAGAACAAERTPPAAPVRAPVQLPAVLAHPPRARLESAPDHLVLGRDTLRLAPRMWQDQQPVALHPGETGGGGFLVLGSVGLTPAVPDVRVVRAWLLVGDDVVELLFIPRGPSPDIVSEYASLESVPVRVVAQLRDRRGRPHLLRSGPYRVEIAY